MSLVHYFRELNISPTSTISADRQRPYGKRFPGGRAVAVLGHQANSKRSWDVLIPGGESGHNISFRAELDLDQKFHAQL